MVNLEDIASKFEPDVLRNIDPNNMKKIVDFLVNKNCDFIDEVINNYIDIFLIDYDEFRIKYNELEKEYNDIDIIIDKIANN